MWLFNKEIRYAARSKEWPALRKKHLDKQPCCQACGSCLKPEVHHIVPVHLDPSRELDPDNLITLCDKYCHFVFGHLMNYRSWNTDIIKDAKVYNDKLKNRPP
jgi:5-methylcytosine-specific restriction enzyme A